MLYNDTGRKSKLTENQKKLIEDNLPYIFWYFNRHNIFDEDKQQDLLYSLCRFIHLYDASRGNITTFINAVFNSRRISLFEHEEKTYQENLNKVLLRWTDVIIDDHDPLTLADVIGNRECGFDDVETNDVINRLLEKLKKHPKVNEDDLKIFIAYLTTGNMSEVAKMYEVSRQRISDRIKKVRNLIKSKGWLYS